jgi:hypothetical protein
VHHDPTHRSYDLGPQLQETFAQSDFGQPLKVSQGINGGMAPAITGILGNDDRL